MAHNGYSDNGGGRALGLIKGDLQQQVGGGRVAAVQGAAETKLHVSSTQTLETTSRAVQLPQPRSRSSCGCKTPYESLAYSSIYCGICE